jgi:hypothetical protein
MKYSERAALFSVIVGIASGFLSHIYLRLGDIWTPLPYVVALVAAGSAYEGSLRTKAYERLADDLRPSNQGSLIPTVDRTKTTEGKPPPFVFAARCSSCGGRITPSDLKCSQCGWVLR